MHLHVNIKLSGEYPTIDGLIHSKSVMQIIDVSPLGDEELVCAETPTRLRVSEVCLNEQSHL
jgi:hypothetical protein